MNIKVPNTIFKAGLSYKAIGLYCTIIQKKSTIPQWNMYQKDLLTNKNKKDSVSTAFKELIEAGFIEKIQIRDKHGRMSDIKYKILK